MFMEAKGRRRFWVLAGLLVSVASLGLVGVLWANRTEPPPDDLRATDLDVTGLNLTDVEATVDDRPAPPITAHDPLEAWSEFAQRAVLPATEDEVRRLLSQTELSQARADEVVALAEPAVALVIRGSRPDALDGGRTQVGGYPLLPPDYPWPTSGGDRLSLVAQVDLDVLPDDVAPWLPHSGLVQFYLPLLDDFYFEQFEGPSVVLWFEDTTDFVRRTDGRAAWGEFVIELDQLRFISLPNHFRPSPLRHWSESERDAYSWYPAGTSYPDQFAGWSAEFQDDPRESAALDEAGLTYQDLMGAPPSDNSYTEFQSRLAAETEIDQWSLLLELGLTPSTDGGGMWGDAGNVSWVARRDLAKTGHSLKTWWRFSN